MEKVSYDGAIIHTFYCDECKKELGSTEEFYDGYYNELDLYHVEFLFDKAWWTLDKHLCNSCKNIVHNKIKNMLLNLGFTNGDK